MSLDKYTNLLRELNEEKQKENQFSDKNDRILLIDGLNTFIRVWSAVPSLNEDGVHVGGIVGFLKSIGALIRQYKPTRCIIVFDGKNGSQRRKKMFPDYKANRKFKVNVNRAEHMKQSEDKELEAMRLQFARLSMYLQQLPITVLSIDNIEADDVIAYLAIETYKDSEIIISSSDKDFLHIINDTVKVWQPVKKQLMDQNKVQEQYGIPAHNLLLYRAFDGDKSDNIPGVNGVGIKTLISKVPIILEEQKTIDDIIDYAKKQIDEGSKYKIYKTIVDGQDVAKRNCELMDLREHNIAGTTKMKIHNIAEQEINRLNRMDFKKMFMVDKMFNALPNIDTWLTNTFSTLDTFAQK